jgi:hypothetical protein
MLPIHAAKDIKENHIKKIYAETVMVKNKAKRYLVVALAALTLTLAPMLHALCLQVENHCHLSVLSHTASQHQAGEPIQTQLTDGMVLKASSLPCNSSEPNVPMSLVTLFVVDACVLLISIVMLLRAPSKYDSLRPKRAPPLLLLLEKCRLATMVDLLALGISRT